MSKYMPFRKFVLYLAANIALRHTVPHRYSLSNSAGHIWNFCHFKVNFLNTNGIDEFLILERPTSKGLAGYGYLSGEFVPIGKSEAEMNVWTEGDNRLSPNLCIAFSSFEIDSIKINRVYGSQSIVFSSILSYLIYELFGIHKWRHIKELHLQRKFRRYFKFSAERIDVLSKIVDWQRDLVSNDKNHRSLTKPFSVASLFSVICTNRVWSLPESLAYLAELNLVIESLAQSGDLKKESNGLFCLEGKALETLSLFETERNRWNSNRKTSDRMVILTAVLAITAILEFCSAIF